MIVGIAIGSIGEIHAPPTHSPTHSTTYLADGRVEVLARDGAAEDGARLASESSATMHGTPVVHEDTLALVQRHVGLELVGVDHAVPAVKGGVVGHEVLVRYRERGTVRLVVLDAVQVAVVVDVEDLVDGESMGEGEDEVG